METDLEEWTQMLTHVGNVTHNKMVVIVHEDDYWPVAARLITLEHVRVQASPFVKKGALYLIPDPEENR